MKSIFKLFKRTSKKAPTMSKEEARETLRNLEEKYKKMAFMKKISK